MNLVIAIRTCPGRYPRIDYPFIITSFSTLSNNKSTIVTDYWPGGFQIGLSTELFNTFLKNE